MYCVKCLSRPTNQARILLHTNWTFWDTDIFFSSAGGSFLVFSAAGPRHAGGPRAHTAQVWAPAEVRAASSGGSKSRKLASNHKIRFRRPRASQAHRNPKHFRNFEIAPPDLLECVPLQATSTITTSKRNHHHYHREQESEPRDAGAHCCFCKLYV